MKRKYDVSVADGSNHFQVFFAEDADVFKTPDWSNTVELRYEALSLAVMSAEIDEEERQLIITISPKTLHRFDPRECLGEAVSEFIGLPIAISRFTKNGDIHTVEYFVPVFWDIGFRIVG